VRPLYLFLILIPALAGCKSDKDFSPAEIWSEGCVTFKSDEDGYKLSGMCCEYVVISKMKLKKDNSFSTSGRYFTYTGAGYQEIPVNIQGKLSDDRGSLDLSYQFDGTKKSFALKAGGATAACLCGCD